MLIKYSSLISAVVISLTLFKKESKKVYSTTYSTYLLSISIIFNRRGVVYLVNN